MVMTLEQHNSAAATNEIRAAAIVLAIVLFELCVSFHAHAAVKEAANVERIKIEPTIVLPGRFPKIEAQIRQAPKPANGDIVVTVIAIVTQPDGRIRSWNWKQVKLSRTPGRTIVLPQHYDTSATGSYRVEVLVYTSDMSRRLARELSAFEVAEQRTIDKDRQKRTPVERKGSAVDAEKQMQERRYAGAGFYGNTLNPAAGATLLLWPFRNLGVQGLWSTGVFTSSEGRLLAKAGGSPHYAFYGGIGYLQVKREKEVIGVATRFEDGGMSGVLGIEVPLGRSALLYVEASGAKINLKRTVTNGSQTVDATVKYAPLTVGISLVVTLF